MAKKLVVLGAAESGIGAAILARKQGYEVFVSDAGSIRSDYKQRLSACGLPWEERQHSEELILCADEVVKSPGIPENAPIIVQLRERGIPIISEIELAGRYTDARMVCITGSNGKTTTTSLIYYILRKAGYDVGLAGNIGHSLALQVAEKDREWYVIELSSFQLDDMYLFRANVAVLLNITPDHLDRYEFSMRKYVDSKMRILQNMCKEDLFIYWEQDEYIPTELMKRSPSCRLRPFRDEMSAMVDMLSIPGLHNRRNGLAALFAAEAAGVPEEIIREGLADFPGVEHRMERVGMVDDVCYINDSKATNVDACYCALSSVDSPVILILGGLDKGNDYTAIMSLVRTKCRALVFLGADNTKLHQFFDQIGIFIRETHSMRDCVSACAALACPGDTVLLSPCCASFDLFKNMEDRGEQFRACVKNLQMKGRTYEGA